MPELFFFKPCSLQMGVRSLRKQRLAAEKLLESYGSKKRKKCQNIFMEKNMFAQKMQRESLIPMMNNTWPEKPWPDLQFIIYIAKTE